MARLVPKATPDDAWKQLSPNRDYAVLCNPQDTIYFRFGQGRSMFMSLEPSATVRTLNSIDFENGEPALIAKLNPDEKNVLGRTSDCSVKVMHAIISRQHLEMMLKGNVLIVRDLGSTNGSYISVHNKHFDIEEYLQAHPLKEAQESTMDWVHEAFGPDIDTFLKNYSEK